MNAVDMLNSHKHMLNSLGRFPEGIEYLDKQLHAWSYFENPTVPVGRLSTNQPATLGGYLISAQNIFGASAPVVQWLEYLINKFDEDYQISMPEQMVAYGLGVYNQGEPFTSLIPGEGNRQ